MMFGHPNNDREAELVDAAKAYNVARAEHDEALAEADRIDAALREADKRRHAAGQSVEKAEKRLNDAARAITSPIDVSA